MVKLRMNSCDEVNHGGVRYPVSNSGTDLGIGEVDVPLAVAAVLLSVSAGATLAEPPEIEEPEGLVRVKHIEDAGASFGWRNEHYVPDADGVLTIPVAASPIAASHGFLTIASPIVEGE